ncbi:UNVERIFIED_CONTAM: hypothetical protein HDU68_001385, partial [Siphonaria sp. JEL0065]
KRAATHGLMNGECPKQSHTRKDNSFSSIDHSLQNAMALLEKEATPAQVPPAALIFTKKFYMLKYKSVQESVSIRAMDYA